LHPGGGTTTPGSWVREREGGRGERGRGRGGGRKGGKLSTSHCLNG